MKTDLTQTEANPNLDVENIEIPSGINVKHWQVMYGIDREKFLRILERVIGQDFNTKKPGFELVNINVGKAGDSHVVITLVDRTALKNAERAAGQGEPFKK